MVMSSSTPLSTSTPRKVWTTPTSKSRLGSILTSTWQGFLDDFENMHDLIEESRRDLECRIAQISRPRFEEACSSRSKCEQTSWEQACPETSKTTNGQHTEHTTSTTSKTTAELTTSMLQPKSCQPQATSTSASRWMSTPTPVLQQHWKAEVELMSPRQRLR